MPMSGPSRIQATGSSVTSGLRVLSPHAGLDGIDRNSLPPIHQSRESRSARCRPFSLGCPCRSLRDKGWRGGAHHLSVFTSHVRCRRRPENPAAATACFVTAAACSRLGPAGATDPVLRVSQARGEHSSDLAGRADPPPSLAGALWESRAIGVWARISCFRSMLIKLRSTMVECFLLWSRICHATSAGMCIIGLPMPWFEAATETGSPPPRSKLFFRRTYCVV